VGISFDPKDPLLQLHRDRLQPYRGVYEALRARAIAHYDSSQEPVLGLCEKPHRAQEWAPPATEETLYEGSHDIYGLDLNR
jgi:hypothetical protein